MGKLIKSLMLLCLIQAFVLMAFMAVAMEASQDADHVDPQRQGEADHCKKGYARCCTSRVHGCFCCKGCICSEKTGELAMVQTTRLMEVEPVLAGDPSEVVAAQGIAGDTEAVGGGSDVQH